MVSVGGAHPAVGNTELPATNTLLGTVDPAVLVDDATCRIGVHAGGADVVRGRHHPRGPRLVGGTDGGQRGAGGRQRAAPQRLRPLEAVVIARRQLPVQPRARHPERVDAVVEHDAAGGIGRLLGPASDDDPPHPRSVKLLGRECRRCAGTGRDGGEVTQEAWRALTPSQRVDQD